MSLILHIIPHYVFLNQYQGSYKDVIGRIRLLENNSGGYRQVILEPHGPMQLDELLGDLQPSHILVEYSSLGPTVAALRLKYPEAFIAVRAHNIEPLQQFDNRGWFPLRKLPQLLYSCLRLLHTDWMSARNADTIYSISQWEAENYWCKMPGCNSVHWLPYFTPDPMLPKHDAAERTIIACLPSSLEHRKTRDLVSRFARFAQAAKPFSNSTIFAVSGDLSTWRMEIPSSIELTGLIDDLPSYMTRVKAVALLSPLGYGFKTTIADAIASGCYVIVHPSLYNRCPDMLRPACIIVKSLSRQDVAEALERLAEPFPLSATTEQLKQITTQRLETDFCLSGKVVANSSV